MKRRWAQVVEEGDVVLLTFSAHGGRYGVLGVVDKKSAIELEISLYSPPYIDLPDGTEVFCLLSKKDGTYLLTGFVRLYLPSMGRMVVVPSPYIVLWDRRRAKRFKVSLPASVAFDVTDVELEVTIEDLSPFGARISFHLNQAVFWNLGLDKLINTRGVMFVAVPYQGEIVSFVVPFWLRWVEINEKEERVYAGLDFDISSEEIRKYLEYFSRIISV